MIDRETMAKIADKTLAESRERLIDLLMRESAHKSPDIAQCDANYFVSSGIDNH